MKKLVLLLLAIFMLVGSLASCNVENLEVNLPSSMDVGIQVSGQILTPSMEEEVPTADAGGSTATEPSTTRPSGSATKPSTTTRPSGTTVTEPSPAPGGSTDSLEGLTEIEKRALEKDNLPDNLNYDYEEFKTLSFKELFSLDVSGTEHAGDMITDSVYRRNTAVENRLKVSISHTVSYTQKFTEFAEEIASLYSAGVDEYDAIFIMGNAAIQYNYTVDAFTEIDNLKYISKDAPWWWADAMEEVSYNNNRQKFLIGDICLSAYTRVGTMLVNSTDYNRIFADEGIDGLYDLVLDRKWTVAELKMRASQAYRDPNGDGVKLGDYSDYIGLSVGNAEMIKLLEYGFDVKRYSRDENGVAYLDYDTNRAGVATDALIDLLFETDGVSWKSGYDKPRDFAQGRTLFQAGLISDLLSTEIREMADNYTVVPLPMLDSSQTEYTSNIQNSAQMVGVLKSVTDTDFSSAVIEALCTESYRKVVLPFFETALKIRYARDSGIGKMIDIINDTATKNFLYEYLPGDGCGALITNVVLTGRNELDSEYANAAEYTNVYLSLLRALLNSAN